MEQFISSIGNLGFPIVVSIYLLVRVEEKLNKLTESIIELSNAINSIKAELK